jgi:threonine/homoserine/homoserine lactone efflux protein
MVSVNTKVFWKGFMTGLILQLAIGPVFFYFVNLTLQRSFLDGFVAVFAVTLVDYLYIILAVLGIGQLLKNKKINKLLAVISSFILVVFGLFMIKAVIANFAGNSLNAAPSDLVFSFLSTFALTISNPITIVFFTGIFTAKAMEHDFSVKELYIFGFGVGLMTFIFNVSAIGLLSLIKTAVPILLIRILNGFVGVLFITYGIFRLFRILKEK